MDQKNPALSVAISLTLWKVKLLPHNVRIKGVAVYFRSKTLVPIEITPISQKVYTTSLTAD
jgi:hypothetical protein